MSLAMYAAPFDESSNDQSLDTENAINRKRQTAHNKTIKLYPKENFDQQKVNSVLENVHKMSVEGGDDNMGNFNPPPKPLSIGGAKAAETRPNTDSSTTFIGKAPHPTSYQREGGLDLNNLNANYTEPDEYYKKMIPGYRNQSFGPSMEPPSQRRYYSNQSIGLDSNSSSDVLIKKINYMINLLEEQQDERTHNVTEEVVLYSFLGIFIIFVVDSFTKVGKYVR